MEGPCDQELKAETLEEMMNVGMAHMEAEHPQMAADVKAMPKDDPAMKKWYENFVKNWENIPEDK
jgi:hypothetical protein